MMLFPARPARFHPPGIMIPFFTGCLEIAVRETRVVTLPHSRPPSSGGTPTPFSPPSGPAQRLFQEPPAKSKFLAVPFPDGGDCQVAGLGLSYSPESRCECLRN